MAQTDRTQTELSASSVTWQGWSPLAQITAFSQTLFLTLFSITNERSHLCIIPSVLMWRYTNIPSAVEDAGKKEKRSSLSHLCLEGLLRIFTTCQQRYPDRMTQLLSTMGQTCILLICKRSDSYVVHFDITLELITFCFFYSHRSLRRRCWTRWWYRDELLLHPTVSGES